METILLTHHLADEGLEELLAKFNVIRPEHGGMAPKEALKWMDQCDAVVPLSGLRMDRTTIGAAPKLKLISAYGVGYDHIDVEYAHSKGIMVTNTPDAVTEPTAELAFGLMHAVARRINELDSKMRNEKQPLKWGTMSNLGTGLFGRTLGIIGLGRIGKAVARRALAAGIKIVYHNSHQMSAEEEQKYQATYLPLEELLKTADIISLHAPLNSGTYHLLSDGQFGIMKKEALLINTSRGKLIDEKALVRSLKKGIIAGAALDVFEDEPHPSSELLALENVVLSPHNGTGTWDTRITMNRQMAQNIIRFFEGKEPLSVVK